MNKANFPLIISSRLKSLDDNNEDVWILLVRTPKACLNTERIPPLVSVGANRVDARLILAGLVGERDAKISFPLPVDSISLDNS